MSAPRARRASWAVRGAALLGLLVIALGAGELAARALLRTAPRRAARPAPHLNALEFHDVDHAVAKPPGTFRVLCLGDSFTFARGIEIAETFCGRQERLLGAALPAGSPSQRVEAISFAREGHSTAHEVRMLEHKGGLDYAPDVIVLGYVLNDPEDEWHPLELEALRESTHVREPPGLLAGLVRASALAHAVYERLENTRRYHALVRYYGRLHDPSYPGWEQCRQAFARLAELTRGSGTQVLVAIFPLLDFPLDRHYPFGELHRRVAELARANGFAALDLLPVLAPHAGPGLLRAPGVDPHPSALAHDLAAQAIAQEIARQGWLARAPTPAREPPGPPYATAAPSVAGLPTTQPGEPASE